MKKSSYEMVGGEVMVRRVVDRFYDIMDTDPAAAGIRRAMAIDPAPGSTWLPPAARWWCAWA